MQRELDELAAYLVHRLGRAARKARNRAGVPIADGPKLDPEALAFFKAAVPGKNYLEYGAGGSTLWAAEHAGAFVSVESDPDYVRALHACGAGNVHLARIGPVLPWGKPAFTRPTRARLKRWKAYVEYPWRIMPGPDLVLVDGRFRISCCLYSLARADIPVMFDNYRRRPVYRVVERFADPRIVGDMAVMRRKRDFDPALCLAAADAHLGHWQ